mmetsp:Transcript_39289/g.77291  ORF Transcript_39289/g.77291 Transcript_39289/m.77291 type:complete len:94 (+) Transcript_39289:151-432(+)
MSEVCSLPATAGEGPLRERELTKGEAGSGLSSLLTGGQEELESGINEVGSPADFWMRKKWHATKAGAKGASSGSIDTCRQACLRVCLFSAPVA